MFTTEEEETKIREAGLEDLFQRMQHTIQRYKSKQSEELRLIGVGADTTTSLKHIKDMLDDSTSDIIYEIIQRILRDLDGFDNGTVHHKLISLASIIKRTNAVADHNGHSGIVGNFNSSTNVTDQISYFLSMCSDNGASYLVPAGIYSSLSDVMSAMEIQLTQG